MKIRVARNYTPRGVKGELDLVGYDGETLAFVEVRTRTLRAELTALPELSVTTDKQRMVARTAQRFLAGRHVSNRPAARMSSRSTTTPAAPPKSACTDAFNSAHTCKTRLHTRYNAQLNSCSADSAVWCAFEEACFAGVA